MHPRTLWPDDPIIIEVGLQEAGLALALRHEGYSKYLGVSTEAARASRLQAAHPVLGDHITFSNRRKLVLHNNAEVLVLAGSKMFYWWKFHAVRHAQIVAWRFSFNPMCLVALIGCLFNMVSRRCTLPRIVTLRLPDGRKRRLMVSRILRQKICHRESLHFIPHGGGLRGMFRQFDQRKVRYVVLRWFDELPEIEPSQDVDMLFDDNSLPTAIDILHSQPGIQPCDMYSETGLPRSDFCGTPYYPPRVARRLLEGAVRHKNLCWVPRPRDYFHSLAYHAVYHKGVRSGLPRGETGLQAKGKPGHDYTGILQSMADALGIDAEISLEGLQAYLDGADWGPTPDMLARLTAACPRNRWLQMLNKRLTPEVHDQGLSVFVLRQEAVRRGFKDKMIEMIAHSGFEVLAVKELSPDEVEYGSARVRGGNWGVGPYNFPGGPPSVIVVGYDRNPIRPNRKQRRKFPQRTNGRIYVKEDIRDAVAAQLPADQQCNALHSSDHAAEAWHFIEVFAPEMKQSIHEQVNAIRQPDDILPLVRAAETTSQSAAGLRRAA